MYRKSFASASMLLIALGALFATRAAAQTGSIDDDVQDKTDSDTEPFDSSSEDEKTKAPAAKQQRSDADIEDDSSDDADSDAVDQDHLAEMVLTAMQQHDPVVHLSLIHISEPTRPY